MSTPHEPACHAARIRLALAPVLLIGLLFPGPAAAAALGKTPKAVLTIYTGDSIMPVTRDLQRGIADVFGASERFDISLQAEFLDAYRYPNPEATARFVSFLQSKYRNAKIDLLIAAGSQALSLTIDHAASLFPGVPVVYAGTQFSETEQPKPPDRFASVVSRFDAASTVRLALALQPELKQLIVVSGAGPVDRLCAQTANEQLAGLRDRIRVDFWSALPIDILLRRLSALKPGAAVLYLAVAVDGTGKRFVPQTVAQLASEASPVPIYGIFSTYLGHGMVGGYVAPFDTLGREAGSVGLRILAGADPASLRSGKDLHSYQVDSRQLERWNFSESNLPPNTVVQFKNPTLWDEYRSLIIGTIALVLLQSLLIALLLAQSGRRRKAEQSLQESEQRMAAAAAAANLGLWHYDVPSRVTWTTEHFRRILGLPPEGEPTFEEIIGRLHPDDRQMAKDAVSKAVATGDPCRGRYRVVHDDGSIGWIETRASLDRYPRTGEPRRLNGLIMDVTQSHLLEEQSELRQQQLAHLTRVSILGELSGALAHELNQPLAAILSNAQAAQKLLERSPIRFTEIEEILGDIVSDDRRAGEVIRRVRSLLKRGTREFTEVDLNALINEAVHLTHSELLKRRIQLRLNLASDLHPVLGDRVQLQQVMLNLIVNACDAMARTPVRQRVITILSSNITNCQVCVSVADHGNGIPKEVQDRIFEPFVSTKPAGLGVGLAITQSIVAAHHGQIWAQNAPSGGATFAFTVPALLGMEHEQPIAQGLSGRR